MRIKHPETLDDVGGQVPDRVSVRGDSIPVDEDGILSCSESQASVLAGAWGVDVEDLSAGDEQPENDAEGGICGYEKDDGTECKRTPGWGRDADSGRCKDHYGE